MLSTEADVFTVSTLNCGAVIEDTSAFIISAS